MVPKGNVIAIPHHGFWRDTGTPLEYFSANMDALEGKLALGLPPKGRLVGSSFLCNDSQVKGTVQSSIVGSNSFVPSSTSLHRCIVWDNVQVPEQGTYSNCIFYDDGILEIPI